jgi:putative nucleotidyltransferase with HDIG domain
METRIEDSLIRVGPAMRGPTVLEVYTGTLVAAALVFAGVLAYLGVGIGNGWILGGLAVVAVLAERGSVRLTSNVETSIALVPMLFAAVLFGPLAAMVVAMASMLVDLRASEDRPYLRWATYTASRSITGGVAGIAAAGTQAGLENTLGAIALATIAAAVVAELLDIVFAAITLRLRRRGTLVDTFRMLSPLASASIPFYAPIVAMLVLAYHELSPWTLPLFLLPALTAQQLYGLYTGQRQLAADLLSANGRLERANLSFATALVATLDARDQYTAGHSAAVAIYARDIALRMGLEEEGQQLAHLCGLVHDIGKIGLPPGLLEKSGPMTLEERRLMEEHSAIGERILAKVDDYAEIARVVRHHHERWDGHGYPDGLAADEIPVIARIIAVADAYNAMTSDRPYRDAMPSRVARLRLAQAVESQFDTAVVAAFEAILAGATESYRLGRRDDFRFELQEASAPISALVG